MYKIGTTYDSYKLQTALSGFVFSRGSKIRHLDTIYKHYEKNFVKSVMSGDDLKQAQLTFDLYKACKEWLKNQSTTPDVKNSKTLISDLSRRRITISGVAKECVRALRDGGVLTAQMASFDGRKIDTLAKGTAAPSTASMSGGYQRERESWIASGKTAAISGSKVSEALKHLKTKEKQKIGLAPNVNFDSLTMQEFTMLSSRLRTPFGANQVIYYKKEDRLHLMMDICDRGLLKSALNGRVIDWGQPPYTKENSTRYWKTLHAYAIDRYGTLFQSEELKGEILQETARNIKQAALQTASFNHSSFNAGNDVICAGLIGIENGYLRWLDHNSGHYKPTAENLLNALKVLSFDGADLSKALVGLYKFNAAGIESVTVFAADNFMSDPRGQALHTIP